MLSVLTVGMVLTLLSVDLYANRRPVEDPAPDYDYR